MFFLIITEASTLLILLVVALFRPEVLTTYLITCLLAVLVLISLHLVLRWRSNFGLTLGSFALFWLIADITIILFSTQAPRQEWIFSRACWVPTRTLIEWGMPWCSTTVTKKYGTEIIYRDIYYDFDQKGRRSCPPIVSNRHALFFGCSFAFGEGVVMEKTLPCSFQTRTGFKAYNYARQGFGTGQMLQILNDPQLFESSIPKKGIAVYAFIGDHVDRSVGEFQKLTSKYVYDQSPLFEFDEEGHLISFELAAKPFLKSLVGVWSGFRQFSPVGRALGSNFVYRLRPLEEGVRITSQIIIESAKRYHERFDGEFYVMLWPGSIAWPADIENAMLQQLRNAGIAVIEPPLFAPGEPQRSKLHPLDGHPSAEFDVWLAEYLSNVVGRQAH